jgi:MerR family transcriptional regulator, mercuric resistance operon regulatory protein
MWLAFGRKHRLRTEVRCQAQEISMQMTIGRLAAAAGVHVETIRYYQRRGLLPEPKRPTGGVRRYGEDAAARLRFIKRAQDIGFTLDEVAELLKLERGCRDAHDLAAAKLVGVERRLADLRRIRRTLRELIGRCEEGRAESCPIIDSLRA